MGVDEAVEAHELYKRIVESWSTWPIDREILKKMAGIHNIDVVTVFEHRWRRSLRK